MREFIDRRWGLLAAATGAAVGLAGLFLVAAGFHGYPDSHGQLPLPGSDRAIDVMADARNDAQCGAWLQFGITVRLLEYPNFD
jgi:hypothetical protein